MFRLVSWCETLFQRTEAHEDATSFGQKLIFAAANSDLRSITQPKPAVPFCATQHGLSSPASTAHPYSDLIAFFSKTPPPFRKRRPPCFNQCRGCTPRMRQWKRSSRPSWMRPFPPRQTSQRPKQVCWRYREPGHYLPKCPQLEHHMRRMQHFVDLGTAAEYMLEHELDDDCHEVLTYFADAGDQFLVDEGPLTEESEVAMESWIAEMFAILDNMESRSTLPPTPSIQIGPSTSFHTNTSLGFVPISTIQLRNIMATLTLFSSTWPNEHLFLDTGAPRSICSEKWLRNSQWIPLEKVELSARTPPFRFASHPVCALYGVKIAATITDIHGRPHVLKLFVCVIPPTPISFFLGLTDQLRPGFDICLREKHSSHLSITAI